MDLRATSFEGRLAHNHVSRRQFLKFCGLMTATLALPAHYTGRVAKALMTAPRPPVVWLEFQDCTGDTESFLRASQPGVDELLLDILSLDYHETLMAPAGAMSEKSLQDTMSQLSRPVPLRRGGFDPHRRRRHPLHDPRPDGAQHRPGGMQQRPGNPRRGHLCLGWRPGRRRRPTPPGRLASGMPCPGCSPLINLPGCPANVVNITATIIHLSDLQRVAADRQFGAAPLCLWRGDPRRVRTARPL